MPTLVRIDAHDPVAGAAVELRAASHDHFDVCHAEGALWWPALSKLPTLRYDFFDGAFGGAITAPAASLTLRTEPWPEFSRYRLAGARVRLYVQDDAGAWPLRFDGRVTAEPKVADGGAEVAFAVDDSWLDTPLLATYAGTTGIEGPAELKGQAKPLALGAPRYVPGKLIDTVDTIFQLSAYGTVQGVEAAMERLARLGPSSGDHANLAALRAADIPHGGWATCTAQGLVRFGAPTEGQVSFHLGGDTAGAGGWVRKPGAIIGRLAERAGGGARVDHGSLAALDGARPYNLSLYLDQQTTARQLIQSIAASVNAVALVTWLGQLVVLPVAIGGPAMQLQADGTALPPVRSVAKVEIAPPFKKLAITAARTWAVHALADVAFTAALIDRGPYDPAEQYREGNIVSLVDGSRWLFVGTEPSIGEAPSAGSAVWSPLQGPTSYSDGTAIDDLRPAAPGATPGAPDGTIIGGTLDPATGAVTGGKPAEQVLAEQITQSRDIAELRDIYGDTVSADVARRAAETARDVTLTAEANAKVARDQSQAARDAAGEARDQAAGEAEAAQQSAVNAGGFATTAGAKATIATQKADEAGQQARTATAQVELARTAAGEARIDAGKAAVSEATTLGHRNAAAISAGVSASSAADAGAAALTGNSSPGAAPGLWTYEWSAFAPAPGNTIATIVASHPADYFIVNGRLRVANGGQLHTGPMKPIPFVKGRRYRFVRTMRGVNVTPAGDSLEALLSCWDKDGIWLGYNFLGGPFLSTTADTNASSTFSSDAIAYPADLTLLGDYDQATRDRIAWVRPVIIARGAGTDNKAVSEIVACYVVDVESEIAAAGSAAASATSAQNAATSENAAGQKASASEGSAILAGTRAGEAKVEADRAAVAEAGAREHRNSASQSVALSAENKAASEEAARASLTSAQLAETKAGEAGEFARAVQATESSVRTLAGSAGTSATSAAASEQGALGARNSAQRYEALTASTYEATIKATGDQYFDNGLDGLEPAFNGIAGLRWFASLGGRSNVLATLPGADVTFVSKRRYPVTSSTHKLELAVGYRQGDGDANRAGNYIGFAAFDAAGNLINNGGYAGFYPFLKNDGLPDRNWRDQKAIVSKSGVSGELLIPANAVSIAALVFFNERSPSSNASYEMDYFTVRDVTGETAAAERASAAATSAQLAETKATESGQHAVASNQNRLDAEAARGVATGKAQIATDQATIATDKAAAALTYERLAASHASAAGQTAATINDKTEAFASQLGSVAQRTSTLESTTGSLGATLTQQAGTIADVNYRTRAYARSIAVAGNNRAQITLYADSNNGAGVDIVGDVGIDGNLTVNGSLGLSKVARAQFGCQVGASWPLSPGTSVAPAPGQKATVIDLVMGSIGSGGSFLLDIRAYLESNAGTQNVIHNYNGTGKPLYTNFLADGGVGINVMDGGSRVVGRDLSASLTASLTYAYAGGPFTGRLLVDIFNGSTDTGVIDRGEYFTRDLSATCTLYNIAVLAKWTFI